MMYPGPVPTTYERAAEVLSRGRTRVSRERRKLDSSCWLERIDDHSIAVRMHSTYIIVHRDDGTSVLDNGGWQTITTKERMRRYSNVRLFSNRGEWRIDDGTRTPERVIKCSECHGKGIWAPSQVFSSLALRTPDPRVIERAERERDETLTVLAGGKHCWGCDGYGYRIVGNRLKGIPFYNGMIVDSETGQPTERTDS